MLSFSMKKYRIDALILLVFLFVLIINPYTIVGPLSYYISVPLVAYSISRKLIFLDFDLIFIIFFMIIVALLGTILSFANGIGQFTHLKVSVSILIYILTAHGVFILFKRRGFIFNDFVYYILLAVLFNSVAIICQVYFPDFRKIIESLLVESGNIDWSEGFRYRGLASSGGASLSVLIPVSIVLCLYLYKQKYLHLITAVSFIIVLVFSNFFIGRTGLLLMPFVLLFFLIQKNMVKPFLLLSFFLLVVYFNFSLVKDILVNLYGLGFYNYTLGFLVNGMQGIQSEGTIEILLKYLFVLPTGFPEVLIGFGYYGGTDFKMYTDVGYSRMFLSVGYFFGTLYYLGFLFCISKSFLYAKYLIFSLTFLLLVAEFKEPLLFSGYSARVLIFVSIMALVDRRCCIYKSVKCSAVRG